ncbi:MAG: dethiobiotin synthase [Planctomycetes bacterium]|nr:dethiobiotin synthase [Planctomycetota bacterium]
MCKTSRGLFISGTDTGVGKTYVAALIARSLHAAGHRVGVYKPAASGCRRRGDELVSDDALALWEAAGCPATLDEVCPQRFEAPLAPHLAARAEGRRIDGEQLRDGIEPWRKASDVIVVEGSGGLMSPLGDEDYVADLALDLGFPLLVVAPNTLGVINQTLQTLITAATFRDGLLLAGVVLNQPVAPPDDPSRASNRRELEIRCVPPVLAEVAWQADRFDTEVDWFALAERSP